MKLKNKQISRKCYNKSVCVEAYNKIHVHINNNKLVKYKITIFVRIAIKFWYEIINNVN